MLQAKNICKAYPGVVALQAVDFDLAPGEVHVLFGENGAGKSTLIGILSGLRRPDDGVVVLAGETIAQFHPHIARQHGIATVFQELSLVPSMSVIDNLFLGREITRWRRLDRKAMEAKANQIFDELGFQIPLFEKVGTLSRARAQMVEIAKALLFKARILILDEPTASLTDSDADGVLDIVRRLRASGVGIIYVSHRIREIRAVADRITVLRAGRVVATIKASEVSETRLVELMTGRRIDALFPEITHSPGDIRLAFRDLTLANQRVRGANIVARAGEVVGIAGLVGCGKSEVGRAAFGLEQIVKGDLTIDGRTVQPRSPRAMLKRRLCYFPSDRNGEGLAIAQDIVANCSMAALDQRHIARFGMPKRKAEADCVTASMRRLVLRPLDVRKPVKTLSGGNRQKVLLGRGLMRDIDIFIFDEPTIGIDVGAKIEVYRFIAELVAQGAVVIIISSELAEVLALSNRIYVMHEGRVVRELQTADCTEANILSGFFGNSV